MVCMFLDVFICLTHLLKQTIFRLWVFVSIWLVRLCFLGKVLAVERASKPTENNKHQQGAGQPGKHSSSLMKDAAPMRDLNKGSKLGSFPSNEPIAERLDVDYPFPPHLEYVTPSHFFEIPCLLISTMRLRLVSCLYGMSTAGVMKSIVVPTCGS